MMILEELSMKGYVTIYKAVTGLGHAELEHVLGFDPGTLGNGYRVYQLAEFVGPNDFEWKDRTKYSGGWHFDFSTGEFVQRFDELRAHLGKTNEYNEVVVDKKLEQFHASQVNRLNVRSGPERIIKIVPYIISKVFPDSPFGNIPQWRLTKEKTFFFIGNSV
jgi:hypothetical protein